MLDGLLGLPHALEIPFVFDTAEGISLCGDRPDRARLAAAMSEAWLAFARTGDPSHAGIPHWSVYTRATRATMIIDSEWRVESDPWGDEVRAVAEFAPAFR